MNLRFDPGQIQRFKNDIQQIAGYPTGETLPIRAMVFESGALFRLPDLLQIAGARRDRPLLVVMDRSAMRRGVDALKPQLLGQLRIAGWKPEPVWLEPGGDGQVHTDLDQIEQVKRKMRPDAALLSVGSGTVTDIAKHAAYLYQREQSGLAAPFVVYQSANSVSAYTSNMAPTLIGGVKRTLPSRYPDVLVCDLETLRDAPKEMTVAGVGDLLAGFVSFADWYLAWRLGMDSSYSEFAATLMQGFDQLLLTSAPAIAQPTLEGAEILAKLIALAGLAMSLSHATAPLSGFEHVISHVLDLLGERRGRPLAAHGTQAALASILSAEAYRIFLAEFDPATVNLALCYPREELMQARVKEAFDPLDPSGRVTAECWSDYREKLSRWHEQRANFASQLQPKDAGAGWGVTRAELQRRLRPPELMIKILREVGSPLGFEQLTPPLNIEEVRFAFSHASLIRRRLTIGDLFVFLNWDQDALWERVWAASRRAAKQTFPKA
jgi:glycerol-1-phosphate dehydrogenase [NAD(P)+]